MIRIISIMVAVITAVGITTFMLIIDNGQQHEPEMQLAESYICTNDFVSALPPASISYDDNDLIRSALDAYDIQMSSPLKLSGIKATEYCSFFADGRAPMYCTSTELVRNGEFLGNIHMIGTNDSPSAILGVVQSNTIQSGKDIVTAVADSMIKNAFDCQGGTSGPWIEQLSQRHVVNNTMTTKSTINGLSVPVLLELTGSPGNYLWKILIGNAP